MIKYIFFLFLYISTPTYSQELSTSKPWAYWWWMGSAVTREDIKSNLTDYADAGMGGLHIIPIYGVKGYENKYIQFRSKGWYDILDYTIDEAKKLGLGIDITLGTGWPYGGPQVTEYTAAQKFKITDTNQILFVPTGQKVKRAAPGGEGWVLDHFNKNAVNQYIQSFEDEFRKKIMQCAHFIMILMRCMEPIGLRISLLSLGNEEDIPYWITVTYFLKIA